MPDPDGGAEFCAWLCEKYTRRLIGFFITNGASVADGIVLAQDVIEKVFEQIGGYDRTRDFEAWLFKVALNHMRDEVRGKNTRKRYESAAANGRAKVTDGEVAVTVCIGAERMDRLHKALDELRRRTPIDCRVFELRVLKELSFAEIGKAYGRSDQWASNRYDFAKQRLRTLVDAQDQPTAL